MIQRPSSETPSGRLDPQLRLLDLHSQLEDILSAVWQAEANWRFDDRLDMALKQRRQEAA